MQSPFNKSQVLEFLTQNGAKQRIENKIYARAYLIKMEKTFKNVKIKKNPV